MKQLLLFLLLTTGARVTAQNSFNAIIKDQKDSEPVAGALVSIDTLRIRSATDADGFVHLENIPAGSYSISFRGTGYEPRTATYTFPLPATDTIIVYLTADAEELNEVVVQSTRNSRTVADNPTRIEAISGEELEERGNMRPGDLRELLGESTGIQMQQTSATSANASIRIQGLDGRYTQVLKDGFPVFSGAASGLGLLQTPPLDLKQVEIIKGAASTLYGGGAIAGLVNLISKAPTARRELRFLLNGTSAGGLDASGYYGQRFGGWGTTIFASRNSNAPYDPSGTGLTAIPKFERYTLNPKIFFYPSEKTTAHLGINATTEARTGGDLRYLRGKGDSLHRYFEKNDSRRVVGQAALQHQMTHNSRLSLRGSYSYFQRAISIPGYRFDGTQHSTFGEATYATTRQGSMEWIGGANVYTDAFREKKLSLFPLRDYTQITFGAFAQNTWKATEKIVVESGLRGDYVLEYGFALLPRISVLYRPGAAFTSRIGGGLGYKAPTPFTEESESIQYRGVLPVSSAANRLERSYGGNWDVNYRSRFAGGKVSFSINQLFFYTRLTNPLLLTPTGGGSYSFTNSSGYIESRGAETNIRFGYRDLKLFVGYTFTDASVHSPAGTFLLPLTPKHRINGTLVYEVEEAWKLGVEGFYYSPQQRADGPAGRDYWIAGASAEKLWEHFSLYINVENFLDIRQTKYETIYTGSIGNPEFKSIYAPLDGIVFNGGIKLRL